MEFQGLTNHELFDISKKNNIKLTDVLMVDELNKLKHNSNRNMIINLDKKGGNGSHWTCLIIKKRKACYVDSFGAMPHKNVIKFCMKHGLGLFYSAYICQSLDSKSCGFYCMKAIKFLQSSCDKDLFENANQYINLYEPLFEKQNEQIVLDGFKLKKD